MSHKKVLLYLDRNQFLKFNYQEDPEKALYVHLGANSGNSVFQFALQSILSEHEVDIDTELLRYHTFLQNDEYYNNINEKYDCIVYSPANIISEYVQEEILDMMVRVLKKISIPVYAIGLGVQSDYQYSFEFLNKCGNKAYEYIKALLNTGGKIGVRGYFSGECLEKLGITNQDYEVIGCPSIFANGKSLSIQKERCSEEEFRPLFNGFRLWNDSSYYKYFQKYKNSIFVCQDEFYKLLYAPEKLTWKEYQYLDDTDERWLKLYLQDRIKLYGDFPSWYHDIKQLKINFSFGCRIHGNVVPLLAGIPAYIDLFDSRVKELAEYFNIPGETFEKDFPDPYELYEKTDYSRFNKEFPNKFERFENFLASCGLKYRKEELDVPMWEAPVISDMSKKIICRQSRFQLEEEEKLGQELKDKKIVFVAHEFGIFRGNGGIASYLYQLTGYIAEHYKNVKVYVLAGISDPNCDLLKKKNFFLYILPGSDLETKGKYVLKKLTEIQPDYVEVAEYQGLCLESLLYRYEKGKELKDTLFFVDNHTASRECFEWSTELPFKLAGISEKHSYVREYAQMVLADKNISPSDFLSDYVKKRYRLDDVVTLRHPVNFEPEANDKLKERVAADIDVKDLENKFVISCITRFEGRKKQDVLIRSFISFLKQTKADAYLILAGNTSTDVIRGGDVRQHIFEQISPEFRERIKFFDFVQRREKDLIYAVSTLAVIGSVYENYPVAMTEYVFKGVPVMASIYSGCADFMSQTKDIMAFNPFDFEDLTKKIVRFSNLSDENKKKIAKYELEELLRLSEPAKAVCEKLRFFSEFERKLPEKSKDVELKFITEKDLNCMIEDTGQVSIVLHTEENELLAKYLVMIYEPTLRKKSFVYAFGKIFGNTIIDELCASEIIFIPMLKIEKNDIGKYWYELLAEIILQREEQYVFLPVNQVNPQNFVFIRIDIKY